MTTDTKICIVLVCGAIALAYFNSSNKVSQPQVSSQNAQRTQKSNQVSSSPTLSSKPVAVRMKGQQMPKAKSQEASQARSNRIVKAIKKYMDDNFGFKGTEPEWYFAIKKMEVENDTLKVHTDMTKNPVFNELITQTCGAASVHVFGQAHPDWGLKRLEVYGSDGNVLVWRNRISDSCSP